jgi:K+-transporting ATPase KdpF subunit
MIAFYWIGAMLAVGLFIYLIVAMLKPEWMS